MLSGKERYETSKVAMAAGPDSNAEWIIKLVDEAVTQGLHPIYGGSARGWVADLWSGELPWSQTDREPVCERIESNERFEALRAAFKERYGEDCWFDKANRMNDDF